MTRRGTLVDFVFPDTDDVKTVVKYLDFLHALENLFKDPST